MMHKDSDGIYTSPLLTRLGIRHGYSTRRFGDLRNIENRENFFNTMHIKRSAATIGEQVHGIRVAVVNSGDKGNILSGIDGLVRTGAGIALGVTYADCVPMLAVDPRAKIIGTAHAGWKGTLAGIARELAVSMKNAGADINNIHISIGPHIGMCCYNVHEARAEMFLKQFGQNDKIATRISGDWHLDIGYANYQLLLESGILKDHIDAPVVCTSCQVNEFNSFRKDPKDAFGVQMGVITL